MKHTGNYSKTSIIKQPCILSALFTARFKLLLALYLMASYNFHAMGQANCKLEKDEIDAITELRVKITPSVQLCKLNNSPLLFKAQSIGAKKYLKMRYYCYDNYMLEANSDIVFTFTDNTELTLTPRFTPADTSSVSELTRVSAMVVFPLSSLQFDQLVQNPIKQIRLLSTSGTEIRDIKESHQYLLKEILICITDN